MASHKNFPKDKFQIFNPSIRWFLAEEDLIKKGLVKKIGKTKAARYVLTG